jgi:light-regulated signal transduction histidine kinase (bacteriophytochrome)
MNQAIDKGFRPGAKRQYPGTGIDLAVCEKIVERLGGRIWFEFELEKGATFFYRAYADG